MPADGFPSFRNPLLVGLALISGIVCGRLSHAAMTDRTPVGKRHKEASPLPSAEQPDSTTFKASQRPQEDEAGASPDPADFFIVPPAALHRIRVELMKDTTLDASECEILGLEEKQIQELKSEIDSTVLRWREREKTSRRVLPAADGTTLLHIPHTDPAAAEEEWLHLKARVLEISGPKLAPLLHFRLTNGYSPSHQSNAGTGMLNVLTAGYGTLDRLVRIKPSQDGTPVYEVIDFLPTRLKDAAPDEAFFNQLKSTGSHEGSRYFRSPQIPDSLSHLLPLK